MCKTVTKYNRKNGSWWPIYNRIEGLNRRRKQEGRGEFSNSREKVDGEDYNNCF
jgi:hypothetical protein